MESAEVTYSFERKLTADQIIELCLSAGLKRPTEDRDRMQAMFDNSNLLLTAWSGDLLIGFARSVTDFVYCCYLSDLAVRKEFQKQGVGKQLVHRTKAHLGDKVMLLLLAMPAAMEYYPKIGMDKADNAFIIKRLE